MVRNAQPQKEAGQDVLRLDQVSSNALHLDNTRLQELGHAIQDHGLTFDQLIEAGHGINDEGIYTQFVGNSLDRIEVRIRQTTHEDSPDMHSCISGALLAYVLIEGTQTHDIAMDFGGVQAATTFREEHNETLLENLTAVPHTQQGLQLAFENALTGLPDDVNPALARVGAGATILGKIAAVEFTGGLTI